MTELDEVHEAALYAQIAGLKEQVSDLQRQVQEYAAMATSPGKTKPATYYLDLAEDKAVDEVTP